MQSYHFVVNKEHRLSRKWCPQDLAEPKVMFAPDTIGEKRLMRYEAAVQLEKLFARANEEGMVLAAVSGYRSYERQRQIYEESVAEKGLEHTRKYIAPPGASEHQSGLAMDVSCETLNYELEEEFALTKEGIWLAKNASLFGFVIRYPKGKEHITGYQYEPWHIRYVTGALSFYLSKFGLTLEEGISSLDSRF